MKFYNTIEFHDVEVFDSKMTALWNFTKFEQESVFIAYLSWIKETATNLFILICFKSTKLYYTIAKESSNSSR